MEDEEASSGYVITYNDIDQKPSPYKEKGKKTARKMHLAKFPSIDWFG